MIEARTVATTIHGRYLVEERGGDKIVIGFHGYGESAEAHFEQLARIPGIEEWSIVAVQALRTFYAGRTGQVVANWMTSQDRELAIADNIDYVRRIVAELPPAQHLVFCGFSQGVAMAMRAAAHIPCAGLIALGGEVPPDVVPPDLPPLLLARGSGDEWYSAAKFDHDRAALIDVSPFVFEGGHEWTEAFRAEAGRFLSRFS